MTKILIKAPNWLGDCVMATPAIALLRRVFPQAVIDVLARPSVAEVYATNPHLNSLLRCDERRMDRGMRHEIKSRRYDAAAIMPNSLNSAWSALRLGIPRRVGYARAGRRMMLTDRIPYDPCEWRTPAPKPLSRKSVPVRSSPVNTPRHMVFYYMRIAEHTARALGQEPGEVCDDDVQLELPTRREAEARVDALLAGRGLTGRMLVGINPGAAAGGAKRWPADRLAAAADALAERLGAEIVCTSIRSESALADMVEKRMSHPLHRLGEALDLHGTIALFGRLAVFITNDSGAMHMAAARGAPIVGVYGPTDWNVTYPWNAKAVVVRAAPPDCAPCLLRECPIDHRCMTAVTVEAVTNAAVRLARQ